MNDHATEHAPHPLDIALGVRIRLQRRAVGVTQAQLARSVGITFQQVQKYEHGSNRVGFSRLVQIARALRCSLADMIGDVDTSKRSPVFALHVHRLNEPGAAELLDAYVAIPGTKRRRAILNLAKELAERTAADVAD